MNGNFKPLISIVTAAYNHERYIQASIMSLVNQDYENLEFIIIDDGSPDSTLSLIKKLEDVCKKRFKRFIVETQKNTGTVVTLNRGLSFAKGDYIFFFASDDIAEPSAISTLYNFLSSNSDYALAVGNNRIIDRDSKVCFWDKRLNCVYEAQSAAYLTFMDLQQSLRKDFDMNGEAFGTYSTLVIGNYFPIGILVRKKIMDQINGFSLSAPLEDLYLMLQISKIGKMKFLNQVLASYRWHGTNSARNKKQMLLMTLKTLQLEKNYCAQNGLMNDWRKYKVKLVIKLFLMRIFDLILRIK